MSGVPDGDAEERAPWRSPGEQAMAGAAIAIGVLSLGIQLWALSVALELYLEGEGDNIWGLVVLSGLVFGGGLLALHQLRERRR